MNKNKLTYKGYFTEIEYSEEDKVLFGKIEGISDLVNFESDSAKEIAEEFHKAVDDYLAFCKEVGKEPDKTYKGSFNIRITPELHKRAALYAQKMNETLNSLIGKALENYLKEPVSPSLIFNIYSNISNEGIQNPTAKLWENFKFKDINPTKRC